MATIGSGYTSDIAIDEVVLSTANCTKTETTNGLAEGEYIRNERLSGIMIKIIVGFRVI